VSERKEDKAEGLLPFVYQEAQRSASVLKERLKCGGGSGVPLAYFAEKPLLDLLHTLKLLERTE
jgi:hypothetical protein